MKKTTNDILDKLDKIIGETTRPKQDDEFTVSDYIEYIKKDGRIMSESQVYKKLKNLEKSGHLTSRKGVIGCSTVNLFKYVKQ